MQTEIDLSEDANYGYDSAALPPVVMIDDGDVLLRLADVTIRMNYPQFERLMEGMNAWWQSASAEAMAEFGGPEED